MILSLLEAPSVLGALNDTFLGRKGHLVPSWDNLMETTEQEKVLCIGLNIVPISVVMMNC